jgi:catalase
MMMKVFAQRALCKVWNNTPVFFIRDPAKFPSKLSGATLLAPSSLTIPFADFIHTQKRNPQVTSTVFIFVHFTHFFLSQTHLKDKNVSKYS